MTQFYEGKGYEGITTTRIFEYENTKTGVRKCCDEQEKMKTTSQTNHIYQQGVFIYKVYSLLTLEMSQSFSAMLQLYKILF